MIVEKLFLGGMCLYKGCIFIKVFLKLVEVNYIIKNVYIFGIDVNYFKINFFKILECKDVIVK